MALQEMRKAGSHEICALLTVVTADYGRISMHGVRRSLLGQQAESLGLPLEEILITGKTSSAEYEAMIRERLISLKGTGVSCAAFGDIFLEDLKRYREDNLSKVGMKGVFPIWKRDSAALAREFIGLGFKAVITCVDSKFLDGSFSGRLFDGRFLAELPPGVDPCGENGEFHSFVYDGPIFKRRISWEKGEVVLRDERYYFCDLIPEEDAPPAAADRASGKGGA